MVFHRPDPKNFEGPGGTELDPLAFHDGQLKSDLAQAISSCCLEHSAQLAEWLLERYTITPKPPRKYP